MIRRFNLFQLALCCTLLARTNAKKANYTRHTAISNVSLLVFETDASDQSASLLVSYARAAGLAAASFGAGHQYGGFGMKYALMIPILKSLNEDTLVVVADARDVLLNLAVQNAGKAASMNLVTTQIVDRFLGACQRAKLSPHTTVVASAEHQCCVGALTYMAPGDAFDSLGGRGERACWSGKPGCTWTEGGEIPWMRAMEKVALDLVGEKRMQVIAPYMNAGLMVGTAVAWLQLISELQLNDAEDDQAVLTAYMIERPGKILLDYDGGLFGANRWPLGELDGCMYGTSADSADVLVHRETQVKPVFLHSPGKLYECHNHLAMLLSQKSVQRNRRVQNNYGNYGNRNYGNRNNYGNKKPPI